MKAPWLTIIGMGEGGYASIAPEALMALDKARHVFAQQRLAESLDLSGKTVEAWGTPFSESIEKLMARRGEPTTILATGDPMHFGVGATLAKRLEPGEMRVLPAPSAFSLAAARMGWPVQDVACISLHGRDMELLHPHVVPGNRILALTSDGSTVGAVAALLTGRGYGGSLLTVLGHMGGAEESRVEVAAQEAASHGPFEDFNTLAIVCATGADASLLTPVPGLDDCAYVHDGQMTKSAVRAVTLSALSPYAGALLWDIGAGCGSVAIEWMRAAKNARAIAIERYDDRVDTIERNARQLGVPGVQIVRGKAPDALRGLDAPDAVFIGGGITGAGVFEAAWKALKPGGLLVANVVTLEGEARLASLMGKHGGQLTRIAISHAEPVGGYHGWRPAMAVTQWRMRKGEGA